MSDLKRVEELTLRCLDGLATAAEDAELSALVAEDEEAAGRSFALLDLEATLRGAHPELDLTAGVMQRIGRAQADRVSAGVMNRLQRLQGVEDEPAEQAAPEPARAAAEPGTPRARHARRAAVAGLAAVLLIGVALTAYYLGSRRETDERAKPVEQQSADRGLAERFRRAETEIRLLRAELKRMRALEKRLLKLAASAKDQDSKSLQAIQREVRRLAARNRDLLRDLKRGDHTTNPGREQAREELQKLAALQERLERIKAQVVTPELERVQKLLAEIARYTWQLRTALRLATSVPRPMARAMSPAMARGMQPEIYLWDSLDE